MIFDQLVAPYLRYLSGLPQKQRVVNAILSTKILSTRGRRELIPVKLTRKEDNIFAEPLLKGSGAITALSMADGYIDIPLEREIVDEGEKVLVNLFRGGEFA
jgi:molybdopterin biosynthesis enzyme